MGASAGIMMMTSAGTQGVSALGNGISQSSALHSQADYQRLVAGENARLAEIKAGDAMERGDRAANKADLQTSRLIGAQRASYGAQGVDVNTGSAAKVQSDSATLGALDSLTIKNNAWREAWGYKVQADNDAFAGKFTGMSLDYQGNNTLLTGGMNALTDFTKAGYVGYQYSKKAST